VGAARVGLRNAPGRRAPHGGARSRAIRATRRRRAQHG
jgi:hypothetical protein